MKIHFYCTLMLLLVLAPGCSNSPEAQARKALRKLAKDAKANINAEINALAKKDGVIIKLDFLEYSSKKDPTTQLIEGDIKYSVACIERVNNDLKSLIVDRAYDHQIHLLYKQGVWFILSHADRERPYSSGRESFDQGPYGIQDMDKVASSSDFTIGPGFYEYYRAIVPVPLH